jgi:signal transduction histidine kinase
MALQPSSSGHLTLALPPTSRNILVCGSCAARYFFGTHSACRGIPLQELRIPEESAMAQESRVPIQTPPSTSPRILLTGRKSRMQTTSWRSVLGAALGVGLVSFLTTEVMHYWLVPDIGRNRERLLAEALSALIVSCLVAKLADMSRRQHRLTMARMQVIAEMNHHIRNALAPISLSVDAIENQQLIRLVSDGVDRIDWALREILPREVPMAKEGWPGARRFQTRT